MHLDRMAYNYGLLAPPAIGDIQRSYRSRWYAGRERPRRNVACHDRSGRDDGVVANCDAGQDRRGTTDPDVGTKTNRREPGWLRRFDRMMIGVENGHQVTNQATVAEYDAASCHDRGAGVDEYALAEHKRAILGRAEFDWYRLATQKQPTALDRSGCEEHRVFPVDGHHSRSRTRPPECGGRPEAGGHVTDLDHW